MSVGRAGSVTGGVVVVVEGSDGCDGSAAAVVDRRGFLVSADWLSRSSWRKDSSSASAISSRLCCFVGGFACAFAASWFWVCVTEEEGCGEVLVFASLSAVLELHHHPIFPVVNGQLN